MILGSWFLFPVLDSFCIFHSKPNYESKTKLFMVGKRLSFEETMPQWKEGSEFKAIREKK